ncbi:MAG: alpha/beta hydrolase [Calditrichia bacterium]|nr:alpha/beta hydrolase [Calditrichia bacterium]
MNIIKLSFIFLLVLSFFSCKQNSGQTEDLVQNLKPVERGYAEINKVKLYYEIYGKGEPLLFLHGGLSSSKDFENCIPGFSKHYRTIFVDRRGHGKSYDNNEPYSYAGMGDNMKTFLDYLKIDSVNVIGWSDGGVVGYHLAAKYPSKVKKLIAVGANYLVEGLTDETINWIKTQLNIEKISNSIPNLEEEYKKFNPQPKNFKNFLEQSQKMWLNDPYIPKKDFEKINIPVLLVAGDNDGITLEHMTEMYKILKNSQLCILPNTSHFVFSEKQELITTIALKFLKN